jgi:hypothetical protein
MTKIVRAKSELLEIFHHALRAPVVQIAEKRSTREEKARAINALVGDIKSNLPKKAEDIPLGDRPNYAIVLQYCFSVASLEYRHKVWPYEYMAFSRRVGELWEDFCSAAWDYPSRRGVARITAPSFSTVRDALATRIQTNIGAHAKRQELIEDTNTLIEIIGDINMYEDEVFSVDGVPHVIDFKSGFGSNEKGNMLRLQTVGRAYRIWNRQTQLFLLVRQEENNNYLRVLRRTGLWEVHTGSEAYQKISEFTGADMQAIRDAVIDWQSDLSPALYKYLKASDLAGYLIW